MYAVLREFGLEMPEATELRMWDSHSEVRDMILPERPAGTEQLHEDGLTARVTRDARGGQGDGICA
jgi:nitrile hydratase